MGKQEHIKTLFWGQLDSFKQKSEEKNKITFLKSIPLFEKLTTREVKLLFNIIHERTYIEDEFLFEYRQPGAALFILKTGEIAIEIPRGKDKITEVTRLSDGTFVGELALLDNSPRTASARATKKTTAYSLFRDDLNELMDSEPRIASEIFKGLSTLIGKRLVATTQMISKEKLNENKDG